MNARQAGHVSKVPQVTLLFWIIKIAATTLGETGGDTAPLSGWEVPRLPLTGGSIVARGIAAGPDVARILRTVESRWIEEGFPAEPRVQELLDEVLTQRKAALSASPGPT